MESLPSLSNQEFWKINLQNFEPQVKYLKLYYTQNIFLMIIEENKAFSPDIHKTIIITYIVKLRKC